MTSGVVGSANSGRTVSRGRSFKVRGIGTIGKQPAAVNYRRAEPAAGLDRSLPWRVPDRRHEPAGSCSIINPPLGLAALVDPALDNLDAAEVRADRPLYRPRRNMELTLVERLEVLLL